MDQIEIAFNSDSPIAYMYDIPTILTQQQNLLQMEEDTSHGDNAFQADFTEKYVAVYESTSEEHQFRIDNIVKLLLKRTHEKIAKEIEKNLESRHLNDFLITPNQSENERIFSKLKHLADTNRGMLTFNILESTLANFNCTSEWLENQDNSAELISDAYKNISKVKNSYIEDIAKFNHSHFLKDIY